MLYLSLLIEGNSIRSIERLTKIEKHTILKLLVLAGQKCERLLNDKLKDIPVRQVECDEIWGFVAMKNRTKRDKELVDRTVGDAYTLSVWSAKPN